MSTGWALGSAGFKTALIEDHALAASARAWEEKGAEEIRQQAWEATCQRALSVLQRTDADLAAAAKASPWKVALALLLKERSQASNHWLSKRLSMGSAKYVSYLVSVTKRASVQPEELSVLRASSDLTP